MVGEWNNGEVWYSRRNWSLGPWGVIVHGKAISHVVKILLHDDTLLLVETRYRERQKVLEVGHLVIPHEVLVACVLDRIRGEV